MFQIPWKPCQEPELLGGTRSARPSHGYSLGARIRVRRAVAQLGSALDWGQGVAGSNPVSRPKQRPGMLPGSLLWFWFAPQDLGDAAPEAVRWFLSARRRSPTRWQPCETNHAHLSQGRRLQSSDYGSVSGHRWRYLNLGWTGQSACVGLAAVTSTGVIRLVCSGGRWCGGFGPGAGPDEVVGGGVGVASGFPGGEGFGAVVASAQAGEVVRAGLAPVGWAMMWSQSKYSARAWQPGNRQVRSRALTAWRMWSGMRYLMVVMAASWPVTGSVTSRRQRASGLVHRSRAICEPIGPRRLDSGVQSLSRSAHRR